MRVAITGASGLLGSALAQRFASSAEVVRMVRHKSRSEAEIPWDPDARTIEAERLEATDAVIHLAGENVATGRWTNEKKARIRESRVEGTRLLADTLARLARPPKVLVSASAVGFYGNRGDELLDEQSERGFGFLANVCREWEEAAMAAATAGIRVVLARFGVVLAREGGVLARLLPLFRLGIGGPLGNGRQYMSWIALDDAVEAIRFAIERDALAGPVNIVSPRPVTNRQFTAALGRSVRRPAILPVPAIILRIVLGEMADEMLLSSARVYPRRLIEAEFSFSKPDLEAAL